MVDGERHSPVGQRRGHGTAEPPPGAGDQGHAAPELHQMRSGGDRRDRKDLAGHGGVGAARDMTPSVISCISTYCALAVSHRRHVVHRAHHGGSDRR